MAGDATWKATPTTNSFDDADNWSSGSIPTGIATFGASNTTTVTVDTPTTLGELLFTSAAPAYTLNVAADLTLSGDGIVSNSASAPTINVTGATLATSFTGGSIHINLDGGGLQWEGSSNPGISLSLGANGGTVATTGNNVTLSTAINGIGGLVKQGSGTLTLTGSNTYVGGTTVSVGVLEGNTNSIRGNVVNNATVAFTSDGLRPEYAGVMSGTGQVIVQNSLVEFDGNNTYSGGTTINAGGNVRFATASNLGTGTITLNGGMLSWLGGSADISSRLAPLGAKGGNFNVYGDNVTLASAISGSGSLSMYSQFDDSTLTLTAANTYSGGTNIYGGAIAVSSDANLGAAVGGINISNFNSRLVVNASFSTDRTITTTGAIDTNAGTTLTTTGSVTGSLYKKGEGTLVLAGDTNLGYMQVSAGILELGSSASLGNLFLSGTTLDLNGNTATVQSFDEDASGTVNDGTLILNTSGTQIVGQLAGTAGLVVQGTGETDMYKVSSYSGGTTLQSGTLMILSDNVLGAAGSGLTINNFATLKFINQGSSTSFNRGITLGGSGGIFDFDQQVTFTGAITGSGTLQKSGFGGTMVLAGSNSYTGGTAISSGTVQVGNGGTSGTLGAGPVVDNGILSIDRSNAISLGAVSGTGSLTQKGTGTTTLSAAMTYTGGTTVSAGTLKLGAGASLASGRALTINGGTFSGATFDIGANSQTLGSVSGTGGSLLLGGGTLSDPSGLTLASANLLLGGFGSVQAAVNGAGRLIATGGKLEFTGAVDAITASDIRIDSATGSVLKFDGTVGSMTVHPTVTFNGGAGLLDLSSTSLASFHGVLAGFAAGEGIRIADAAAAALDGTGKILTVYDSAHASLGALSFDSSYTGDVFTVTGNTVSILSSGIDYGAATGGVYTDLAAQVTEHAPAGQGWSGGPGSVTPVSTDHLDGIQTVIGSSFDDLLVGGALSSGLSGGAGNDLIYGNTSQATADNTSSLTLDGGAGNNALYGSSGFNTFLAGDAGGGFNQVWGAASKMAGVSGFANNTLSFEEVATGKSVYVDLLAGHNAYINSGPQNNGTYTLEDSIANVPNLIGSSGGDVLIADNGADRLTGGTGADQLYAGTGHDTFAYVAYGDSNLVAGYDALYGFKSGIDKVDLSALHSDASHLLIQTAGTSNSVYLEATPGSFNANTDLAMVINTAAAGGVHASDFIF